MRRALVGAALVALLAAGSASGSEQLVVMPGRSFLPAKLTVLVGDTVTWENRDTATHTVSAPGAFSSGFLAPHARFSFTFSREGAFAYVCTIHRFMRGEVDAFSIAFSGPARAVTPPGHATLTGLAPAGTPEVTIEARQPDGSFRAVGTVTPDGDGRFAADVAPSLPTDYRAAAGDLHSPVVTVSVSAAVRLAVVGTERGALVLLGEAVPGQAGARVVLERYARELFSWVPVARGRLGDDSRARFRFTPHRRVQIRVRMLDGVGGFGPGVSRPRTVRPKARLFALPSPRSVR